MKLGLVILALVALTCADGTRVKFGWTTGVLTAKNNPLIYTVDLGASNQTLGVAVTFSISGNGELCVAAVSGTNANNDCLGKSNGGIGNVSFVLPPSTGLAVATIWCNDGCSQENIKFSLGLKKGVPMPAPEPAPYPEPQPAQTADEKRGAEQSNCCVGYGITKGFDRCNICCAAGKTPICANAHCPKFSGTCIAPKCQCF